MTWLGDIVRTLWPTVPVTPIPDPLDNEDRMHPAIPPDLFLDLRPIATREHVYGTRPWAHVTGVCLHQTACVLGERPQRWRSVGAHLGVTRAGKLMWLHDFTSLVAHGNGWNARTVGIEIDGMYAGVEGDASTFWHPKERADMQPMHVTPEAMETARQAVRWIVAEVAAHGGHVRALVAHRQASKDRRSDPGSAIWQSVAVPLHAELGLGDGGQGFKLDDGYPIPSAWDAGHAGVGY